MAIMIKENISALIVVAQLIFLWMNTMVKRDEVALDAIKYLTNNLTKEFIMVKLYPKSVIKNIPYTTASVLQTHRQMA